MGASALEQAASFAFPSSSGISRRSASSATTPPPPPPPPRSRGQGPLALHPDIDPPPPPPRPVFQLLAFLLILFFAALQFLPATHFRDPADPLRIWIPFTAEPASPSSLSKRGAQDERQSKIITNSVDVERIDIISWVDCLDLRVLGVLINSTLSNSRVPEKVHFHFLISKTQEEKLSYYKLKVLFPDANIDIIGQKEIEGRTKISAAADEQFWLLFHDILPLIISKIYPSLRRCIYVSPNTIMKGSVEELLGVDLGTYAIAAAEDCGKHLGSYVNIDVLNAIQRTAAKTWVSEKPYDENACAPDLNVLLVDAKKLDKYLLEAFLWWNKVLGEGTASGDGTNPSIVLTLYQKYLKLSTSWKFTSKAPEGDDNLRVFSYDGEIRECSQIKHEHKALTLGNMWRQYLTPESQVILGH